jgi:hypothetical protein
MTRRTQMAFALLPLLAAATVWSAVAGSLAPAAQQPVPHQDHALDDAQVRALVQRAIDLQHWSDDALDVYDRTERTIDREDEKTKETTVRTVPVGASDVRVDLNRDGQPVPPAEIAQKWSYILSVMEERTHTEDPEVKKEYEKAAKRRSDSAKMVDAIGEAFLFHWAGRTERAGRPVIELDYEPNPGFESKLRFSGVYKQIYGKVWVDEASGYVVRLEAELRRDIPIGGGIVGKVYKGSRIEIQQAEPAPGAGVWLPTFSSYDVEGRKFIFPASLHRKRYASEYRRIGPPAEALSILRSEHAQAPAPVAIAAGNSAR